MLSGELADLEAQRKEDRRKNKFLCSRFDQKTRNLFAVLKRHPIILIVTITVLVVLCCAGLGITFYVKSIREENVKVQATQLAHDTVSWFCKFQ